MENKIFAQYIEAITTDGKWVLLHENGKWEFNRNTEIFNTFSFRKTNWGMSKSQVQSSETEETCINDDADNLSYQTRVANLDAFLFYNFVDNKLVNAAYGFKEEHSNQNKYIDDYFSIQEVLKKKYGEPTESDMHWNNNLYQDDVQDWGRAISIGHLIMYSRWELSGTRIHLRLGGDNHQISHFVTYVSGKLEGLMSAKTEKDTAELF